MKNEKDFLDGMWDIVEREEKLEIEKNIARKRNRELMKKNILVLSSIVIIFILILIGSMMSKYFKEFIYFILSISLLLGYLLDRSVSEENKFERIAYNGE